MTSDMDPAGRLKPEPVGIKGGIGAACIAMLLILSACGPHKTPVPIAPTPGPAAAITASIPRTSAAPTQTVATVVKPAATPVQTKTLLPTLPETTAVFPTSMPATVPIPTGEPTQPPPSSVTLLLPLGLTLEAPPGGQPDIPLFGVTALALDPVAPAGFTIAAGTNQFGVLISRNGGQDWSWSQAGLPAGAAIRSISIAHGELIVLVEGGGAYYSTNGETWTALQGLGSDVDRVSFSPAYPGDGVLYAVRAGALLRSADRGASWFEILPANACPLNVAFSPNYDNDKVVYAPRCDHIVRSSDGGLTWTDVTGDGAALQLGYLSNLAAADELLLAQGNTQGLPVVSYDGGSHWEPAYNPRKSPFGLGGMSAPVRISEDGAWYLAGDTSMYDPWMRIWRSTDRGQTWFEVAQTTAVTGMDVTAGETVWAGTWDGVFSGSGGNWRLVHPGGSRPALVDFPAPGPLAISRQSVDKYTTRLRLFEKQGDRWQFEWEETSNYTPLRAFPAPDTTGERLILLLCQDYGGQIHVLAFERDAVEPLVEATGIPLGMGDSIDRYRVQFAQDYEQSGRIDLVHGGTGALYTSTDRGVSWSRHDPAEPDACQRNPVSGFGNLWSGNQEVRNRLLCPLEDEAAYAGTMQPFEHGELLRLDPITTSDYDVWVYIFIPNLNGQRAWNTLPYYDQEALPPTPPEGYYPVAPIFTSAWLDGFCCQPDFRAVPDVLGWAVGEARPVDIARQQFEGGTMVWRGDRDEILVLVQAAGGDTFTIYPD